MNPSLNIDLTLSVKIAAIMLATLYATYKMSTMLAEKELVALDLKTNSRAEGLAYSEYVNSYTLAK